jgi:hypothetical protein
VHPFVLAKGAVFFSKSVILVVTSFSLWVPGLFLWLPICTEPISPYFLLTFQSPQIKIPAEQGQAADFTWQAAAASAVSAAGAIPTGKMDACELFGSWLCGSAEFKGAKLLSGWACGIQSHGNQSRHRHEAIMIMPRPQDRHETCKPLWRLKKQVCESIK